MKVHSTLGNGYQEVIYQRALEIEMSLCGLGFEREKEMAIHTETIILVQDGLISLLKIKLW
jgi:GxxExxY protein